MSKISIIMGAYNAEKRISKAIQSIIDQTFDDWELIVCDDGSTDLTANVVKSYSQKDQRIKLISNKKNSGLAFSLNNCILNSTSEYIARMDDDDISFPDRLRLQYLYMENNPECSILGTARKIYDENGIWGEEIKPHIVTKNMIIKTTPFIHPSVMIRRKDLIEVGMYTVSNITMRTEDIDLWIKLYTAGKIGHNLNQFLIYYFEGKESYTKRRYVYRVHEAIIRIRAIRKLHLNWISIVFPLKTLFVGLLPAKTMIKMKHKRFKLGNKDEF